MDKVCLYKLQKDILVEFVCKNFNNLSVKEFGQLYREKCLKEMNKYRQLLYKPYSIRGFLVNYKKGGIIYVAKYVGFYREIYILDNRMEDMYGNSSVFQNMSLLLVNIKQILVDENFESEDIDEMIKVIEILVKTYYEKKEMKKDIKNNNLYF